MLMVSAHPLLGINYYMSSTIVEAPELNSRSNLEPYGSLFAWGQGRPLVGPLVDDDGDNTVLVDSLSSAAMSDQGFGSGVSAFSSESDEQAFCIESVVSAHSTNQLSAMLVYTDFPASVPSSTQQGRTARLVNDLDVWSVDSACTVGYANGLRTLDRLNNAERVTVRVDNALAVTTSVFHVVVVRAARLTVAPQHYSLAFTHLGQNANSEMGAEFIVLSQNSSDTSLPSGHPCSQIYSSCTTTFNSLRQANVPQPSPPPSTTGPEISSTVRLHSSLLAAVVATFVWIVI
jgi:hypothetical protein